MSETLNAQVRGADDVEVVKNALETAADDLGGELKTSRGRATGDEVPKGDALVQVCEAYTGWDNPDDSED